MINESAIKQNFMQSISYARIKSDNVFYTFTQLSINLDDSGNVSVEFTAENAPGDVTLIELYDTSGDVISSSTEQFHLDEASSVLCQIIFEIDITEV